MARGSRSRSRAMAGAISEADAAGSSAARVTAPGPVERAAPALFLLFWSSGFVAAKLGLEGAAPITFLALRFCIVTVLMLAIALALGAPWPRRPALIGHILVTGLIMQAIYFSAAYLAFDAGVTAGGLALIVGMQPVVTACLAAPFLGERVRWVQVLGLVLGVAGIVLVLAEKLGAGLGSPFGVAVAVLALFAITTGTLYQKRFCPHFDLWTGGTLQFAIAALATGVVALLFEDNGITWTPAFTGALAYLVFINSIIAIALLNLMLRRGEAGRVASLFFLVPPGAALVAYLVLGETLGITALIGMAVATVGVALVMRRPSAAPQGSR
jgi:drug/metabolite transporter (DMT)-like permease